MFLPKKSEYKTFIFDVRLESILNCRFTLHQARGLVRFCKSAETYTYVRKNLLFSLKRLCFLSF